MQFLHGTSISILLLQEEVEEVIYSVKNHPKFLNSVQRANGICCLDLSDLQRSTQAYTGGRTPKWKPDAKLEAVVATLLTTTKNVKVCMM